MLRQRKLARLCAFIACERTWTDPPVLALGFIQASLSGPVCCSETAAGVPRTFPRNNYKLCFLLPSTINRHCVELVAGLWNKWILIHALLSRAVATAEAFLC